MPSWCIRFIFKSRYLVVKMLEAQLVPLMNKYLSSFIEGIENEDLQLSLWNGYVSLRNIVNIICFSL